MHLRSGVVWVSVCVCLCWAGPFPESSWLALCVPAHSAHWQPGGQAGQRVPTQLPIERQRYGHNVSDRLAVSTAPPFLLLWPEINHKYPPHPCALMAQPHQTPSGSEKRGTLPFPSRHTQVKATSWKTQWSITVVYQCHCKGVASMKTQIWWIFPFFVLCVDEITCQNFLEKDY